MMLRFFMWKTELHRHFYSDTCSIWTSAGENYNTAIKFNQERL